MSDSYPHHTPPSWPGQESTQAPLVNNAASPSVPPVEPPKAGKKSGPKPVTDEPTKRFEGQLYVPQHNALSALLTRLSVENKATTPASERRRLTINTFVRLGIEIVLSHEANLHGKTEQELLASLRASIAENPEGLGQ